MDDFERGRREEGKRLEALQATLFRESAARGVDAGAAVQLWKTYGPEAAIAAVQAIEAGAAYAGDKAGFAAIAQRLEGERAASRAAASAAAPAQAAASAPDQAAVAISGGSFAGIDCTSIYARRAAVVARAVERDAARVVVVE